MADEGEAGAPSLFGQPVFEAQELSEEEVAVRAVEFEAFLDERGWEQHGDIIGPPELFADGPDPQAAQNAEWSYPPHRATIFLNFYGGALTNGTNAALNESTCIKGGTFDYPGFAGGEAQALAIIETFESQLAPYGVRIAYEDKPPPELPYAMVMMGGTPQMIGMQNGVLGVSCSSDCGDRWWRDATLAFTAAASPSQTNMLATTALHEAAHAFGLGHIDESQNSGYIMHPYVDNSERAWAEGCVEYNAATGGINCKPTHDIWCGGGAQDTNAELLAYFGANSPDIEAPVVEILSPPDGLEIAVGGSVEVEAEVTDNHDGVGWKIMIYKDGELVEDKPSFFFENKWPLSGLPAGDYLIRVQAIDHDRNIGADEVTVHVGTQSSSSTGGDTEGTTGDDSGGTDGTDGGTTGDTGDTGGSGESEGSAGSEGSEGSDSAATVGVTATAGETAGDEDPEGCACVSGERPASGGLWLLAGLLGLLGRRRR
jgi:MYXO-CTERM domain-containing protein